MGKTVGGIRKVSEKKLRFWKSWASRFHRDVALLESLFFYYFIFRFLPISFVHVCIGSVEFFVFILGRFLFYPFGARLVVDIVTIIIIIIFIIVFVVMIVVIIFFYYYVLLYYTSPPFYYRKIS